MLDSLAPFESIRILGEGGGGIVYAARLEPDVAPIALKVLRTEIDDLRAVSRFLDEAERMRRLDHPGLVRLLDSGVLSNGRPFLTMPLLQGETLAARLTRGPLDRAEALRHFGVLANALHAVHEAGMVHRDVKPENVLLVDDGTRAVLFDFGIARDVAMPGSTTTDGRVRGTPAYMAPERFFGSPADVRSDVYELAVVLYAMLVGRLPWNSDHDVHERLNPRDPREVPRPLAAVILRALSTRPEMRPPSVKAFAAAIEDCVRVPSTATTSSRRTLDMPPRTERTKSRRPALAAIGAALVGGLALFAMRPKSAVVPDAPSVVVAALPSPTQPIAPPTATTDSEQPHAIAKESRARPASHAAKPARHEDIWFEDRK